MGKGIAGLEAAYQGLFTAVLILLAALVILCLVRAIIGPRTADRIVSVNMMGTMVIVIIAILTVMLGEGYLADICIIYAMISFLAVIVLTKVYMGVYLEQREAKEGQKTGIEEMGENKRAGVRKSEEDQRTGIEEMGENKRADVRKSEEGQRTGTEEMKENRRTDAREAEENRKAGVKDAAGTSIETEQKPGISGKEASQGGMA